MCKGHKYIYIFYMYIIYILHILQFIFYFAIIILRWFLHFLGCFCCFAESHLIFPASTFRIRAQKNHCQEPMSRRFSLFFSNGFILLGLMFKFSNFVIASCLWYEIKVYILLFRIWMFNFSHIFY